MKHQVIAPEWTTCDEERDLSDNLHDADRLAADEGHECIGYYDRAEGLATNSHHEDVACDLLVLHGIKINRGLGRVSYHSVAEATLILGADAMGRIEVMTEDSV